MPAKNVTIADVRAVLAKNIRRFRKQKSKIERRRLSQEAAAHEVGIDRTMLSKIETCKTNPSLETLFKLASYFDVGIADLLSGDENSLSDEGARTGAVPDS